jgi:hypothetical protein
MFNALNFTPYYLSEVFIIKEESSNSCFIERVCGGVRACVRALSCVRVVITVFTVFRLLTDFVCLYTYEFWLSLCKIVRSLVFLLLPLFALGDFVLSLSHIRSFSQIKDWKLFHIHQILACIKVKIPNDCKCWIIQIALWIAHLRK